MISHLKNWNAISLMIVLAAGKLTAEVNVHPLFTDHAVLQQGQPVPVWGTAEEGEKVTVSFAGQQSGRPARHALPDGCRIEIEQAHPHE